MLTHLDAILHLTMSCFVLDLLMSCFGLDAILHLVMSCVGLHPLIPRFAPVDGRWVTTGFTCFYCFTFSSNA